MSFGVKNDDALKLLDDIHDATDRQASSKIYNDWAPTYEAGMKAVSYIGPEKLVEFVDKLNIPKSAKILDVGSGTGIIGRELTKRGYTDLHAMDGAENMLKVAQQEQRYKSYTHLLFKADSRLPFDDNSFDCCLLAGVLGPGHIPIVVLREVARVTKPGGVVAWICCDPKHYESRDEQYANGGFYKLVGDLSDRGIWRAREGYPVKVPYIEYSNGFVFVYDVIG